MRHVHIRRTFPSFRRSTELGLLIGIIGITWFLRVWVLGSKGLWYDETITALITRATPVDIIQYHWISTFEHPPLWMLLMREWSLLFGQSESMLRFPSAIAGTLVIPLTWLVLKRICYDDQVTPLITAFFVAISPILLEYSQEARMYSTVVALSLLSLYALLRLLQSKHFQLKWVIAYLLTNWFITGLHYYIGATLLLSEGLIVLSAMVITRRWRLDWVIALLFSGLPLFLWVQLSPGFRGTLNVVGEEAEQATIPYLNRLEWTWRDFTFGNVRRIIEDPSIVNVGYLLLPFLVLGLGVAARRTYLRRSLHEQGIGTLILIIPLLICWLVSLVLFPTLQSRYILQIAPLFYGLVALGVTSIGRIKGWVGIIGGVLVCIVLLSGAGYYFTTYRKSDYREMAGYLNTHLEATSVPILLEGPRQHLLAKYYFDPALNIRAVPDVRLPDYFPVNAPVIVPAEVAETMQGYLRQHDALWVIFTGENEVDAGGFLPNFLAATTYALDCNSWSDVRLCHYLNPAGILPVLDSEVAQIFNDEIALERTRVSLAETENQSHLLIEFVWHTVKRPTIDYKVSVRFMDQAGNVLAQDDNFPIGPLLPPSTWGVNEERLGYWAIPLPEALPLGTYTISAGLYDPATLAPISHSGGGEPTTSDFLMIGKVEIDDTIEILPIIEIPVQ